jgi:large subunit ribosomal protein L18
LFWVQVLESRIMRLEKQIAKQRLLRAYRVRNRLRADGARARLTVFRSNKHIYAQIIDDVNGVTLASASTAEKAIVGEKENGGNVAAATKVGKTLAERALAKGIKDVAFDRGQYRYHGRIAALAEAARGGGLNF